MAPKPLLAGLKVSALGLLLVGENERHSSWLSFESLAELVEAKGGKYQTAGPNSATDIVVTGSFAREGPDFLVGAKHVALEAERANTTRKKRLTVLTLEEFLATYELTGAALDAAVTARFEPGTKRFPPPGPEKRTRGNLFGHILVYTGGELSGVAKGLARGYYKKEELFPEE
jgi:hypothetical protein